MKKVIIIGSGLGGLSTALRLSNKGYDITILEKHSTPGGRLNIIEQDGFRFDMGPSFMSMTYEFDDLFKSADVENPLLMKELDPIYQVFMEGRERPLRIFKDLHKLEKEFTGIENNLGEKLENTGLSGAPRLLAIVDLCSQTIEDMPEYNAQLFTLFMNSDYGGQLGWDITESISQSARQALDEIRQEGELHDWVDLDVLAERIAAQCIIAVLEFCNGDLSIESFAPTFGYSAAMLASAATTGKAQTAFSKRIRKTQKLARRQHNTRLKRTPGVVA